jgi:branched-chain amino acid transport system ATP-binding protein
MTALLDVRGMQKAYGAIRAVDGVSFTVEAGEILGVIGPNGSGKTTLFNAILGQVVPSAGEVAFESRSVTGVKPLHLARMGIGRTFQSLQVFGKLSVRDNLIAAGQEFGGSKFARLFALPEAGLGRRAEDIIALFRIGHVAHLAAGSLSYGQQKLVDIAMAFMSRPRLVLLDEPCAGVNPALIDQLTDLLRRLNREQGTTFIVIEHNMDFVMNLCSRVICMAQGRILAEGSPATVQADRAVLEAYLGA